MQITHTKNLWLWCLFLSIGFAHAQQIETAIFITSNTNTAQDQQSLSAITKAVQEQPNAQLLVVGNMIADNAFETQTATNALTGQLETIQAIAPQTIFIPGQNEWAEKGHKGVRKLEKQVQKNSDAKFYPDNGCPIKKKDLSEQVVLISIDSQWYLEDWNEHIYINEQCDIKNRTLFFLELESILKKSQDKIKVIALYHPIHTYTKQGLFANTAGTRLHDFQNKQYRSFRNRLTTMLRQNENVIVVSGHGNNLQYINTYGVPQIISGAIGTPKKVRKAIQGDFATTQAGYAQLNIYTDGHATVNYHTFDNTASPIFSTDVLTHKEENTTYTLAPKKGYPTTKEGSVYTAEETKRSGVYKGLWGQHYRKYYSKPVNAKVAFLDTLMGGLTPIRKGGGHQSNSLRLVDKDGKQFVMRALRKSAVKFIQSTAFLDKYVEEDLEDSYADRFLLDFYTTAHPYTPFAIGDLADAADVYHTNPTLYYIPKQEALGDFNDTYGDELYLLEERVESSHNQLASFGKPKKILSSNDVLSAVHKTGKSIVDEPSYIRARLFDMLIGDWDRHPDQWRWALFEKEDGTEICKPIPRDRDQAFSMFDGGIVTFLTHAIPGLRKMQSYSDNLRSPKWFAQTPYPLDMTFINNSDWSEWKQQVQYIQDHLTDAVIEKAFTNVPPEMQGETIEGIKTKLKGRKANLMDIAERYYKHLTRFEVVAGTQKNDVFTIKRLPDGKTAITVNRKEIGILNRTFNKEETKEIWLYGLDGKDTFITEGQGTHPIKIKVIGGKKNDTYDFKNTKNIKVYDYKNKPNTIVNNRTKKWLVDDYDIHNYDYKKHKHSVNQLLPLIAYNPDDGLRIGLVNHYSFFGLQRNPFTQKHSISASYYTSTSGFDLGYTGEFSNIFHRWNFGVEGFYTSPSFAQNIFGIGNESTYDDDEDLDFNRARIRQWHAAVSLIWRGRDGGYFQFKPFVEAIEVENTEGRFINTIDAANDVFEEQTYVGAEATYRFSNKNDIAFPTLGIDLSLTAGYKTSISGTDEGNDNRFAYLEPIIAIDHALTKHENLVFATKIGGEAILGDDFEFYHGAQIGGIKGLRGFRNERFIGKYSLYHNSDIRLKLGKFKTSFVPLKYGITGGFDYGRVWIENDNSDKWHTSVGGSFWITGLDAFTANLGYYASSDRGRIAFVLGFAF